MVRQRVMFPWDLISLAAVFWVSCNAPPKQRCVTSKKRLRGRLPGTFIRKKKTYKLKSSIRSLRKDDGNDNKNGKKRNRFRLAERQLCMCITSFHSLRCTTASWIFLISRALFVEVGENTTKFLFLNLDMVLSDSTSEYFPNIWQMKWN